MDGNKYFDIIIGDKVSINHINLNIQSNKILFNNKVYDNLSELNSISDDELMLIFQKNIRQELKITNVIIKRTYAL